MAYQQSKISGVLATAATNWFRPSYMRALAHASVVWKFSHSGSAIKRIPLETLLNHSQDVQLSLAPHTWGETSTEDLIALCTLVRINQPRTIFEFGTFTGHTTLNLVMNANNSARLVTLDLPPGLREAITDLGWEKGIDDGIIGNLYRDTVYAAKISQIYNDSRTFDTTPYAKQMDFIFVDACHEYDFVVNDSGKAFEMVTDCGVIAWHDYGRACPGVCKYLDNLAQTREVFLIEGTQIAFCCGRKDSTETHFAKTNV